MAYCFARKRSVGHFATSMKSSFTFGDEHFEFMWFKGEGRIRASFRAIEGKVLFYDACSKAHCGDRSSYAERVV